MGAISIDGAYDARLNIWWEIEMNRVFSMEIKLRIL
jgi:hypothetical protein